MKLAFINNGRGQNILGFDDAMLIYKNFEGRGDRYNRDRYNREGERNFGVRIFDEEMFEALKNDVNKYGVGWNVKSKPPRNEGDDPFMFLPVKVKFTARGPKVVLITGDRRNELDEESIACLDNIDMERVDLDVRPYDDEVNGKPFRTAYLDKIYVTQKVDRFVERYDMRGDE